MSTPPPEQEAPASLQLPGFRVLALGSHPGRRDREFSHGPIRRFQLEPNGDGPPLTLTLMPVRSRNEKTLQLAAIATLEPRFSIRQRRLLTRESSLPAGAASRSLEELAVGSSPKVKGSAEPMTRLQTCLTPTGMAGVTLLTLDRELTGMREAEAAQARLQTIVSRLLGLRDNTRWECVAVQLETKTRPGVQQDLLEAWDLVKPTLSKP
ncbi:MAG: hypothetical protein VKP70_10645 [Cyanobacteriota bacterium]|nr:hypothetical protein [Cyanobacteriota bacterium]